MTFRTVTVKPLVGKYKTISIDVHDTINTIKEKVTEAYGIYDFTLYNERLEVLDNMNLQKVQTILLLPQIKTGRLATTQRTWNLSDIFVTEPGHPGPAEKTEPDVDPFIKEIRDELRKLGPVSEEYTLEQRQLLQSIYNKMHDEVARKKAISKDNEKLQAKITSLKEKLQRKKPKVTTTERPKCTYMGLKRGFLNKNS